MEQKKLMIIGNYENVPYHPLSTVEEPLKAIFSNDFILDFVTNYNDWNYEELKKYHAIISYTDCWGKELSKEFTAGLQTYVVQGGALLVIHSGISLQTKYELAQLIGGRFTTHPDRTNIQYTDFNKNHPIMEGIAEFVLFEEPYQFELDPFTEKTELFHYLYEGNKYIAAWTHEYQMGKVVYLSPGHDSIIFENEEYLKIIKNSIYWLVN